MGEVDKFFEEINEIKVPREIVRFSGMVQELVLRSKEPMKKGWNNLTLNELLAGLMEESCELIKAIKELSINGRTDRIIIEIIKECSDVQNYAMMIQDNLMDNPFGYRGGKR